jgi:hypothetical protein
MHTMLVIVSICITNGHHNSAAKGSYRPKAKAIIALSTAEKLERVDAIMRRRRLIGDEMQNLRNTPIEGRYGRLMQLREEYRQTVRDLAEATGADLTMPDFPEPNPVLYPKPMAK